VLVPVCVLAFIAAGVLLCVVRVDAVDGGPSFVFAVRVGRVLFLWSVAGCVGSLRSRRFLPFGFCRALCGLLADQIFVNTDFLPLALHGRLFVLFGCAEAGCVVAVVSSTRVLRAAQHIVAHALHLVRHVLVWRFRVGYMVQLEIIPRVGIYFR